jgi:hypothetical protein
MKTPDESRFDADEEVEEVVRRFESGELPPSEFGHREHLAVALLYVLRHTPEEAHEQMRRSIHSFLRAHGEDPAPVYHETLTLFWLRRVRAFVVRAGGGWRLFELANGLAEECGDSGLVYEYYSRAVVDSEEARRAWAGPDLKGLDF